MSAAAVTRPEVQVEGLEVTACTFPMPPESDGTMQWDSVTTVVVEARGGGQVGLGYTYGPAAAGAIVHEKLASAVQGVDALDPPRAWKQMVDSVRNAGRPGLVTYAISAVDTALWDLKARLLGLPLCKLLGQVHDELAVYGSGGFTNLSDDELREQMRGWAAQGFTKFKMKVGRDPDDDPRRARVVREVIGDDAELFADLNGALAPDGALHLAGRLWDAARVSYLEEPVTQDDLVGLRRVRDRAPEGMQIASGEYTFDAFEARRMLEAGCVDILQADITRCGGITELLRIGALCWAYNLPFSAHCAPMLSMHPCAAIQRYAHMEWFHDHVNLERELYEGFVEPEGGCLRPDLSRPGNGLELRREVAARHAA